MGQYHYICSLDKREYLNPHKAGDGLKLLEFGCSSNGTMTLLALLLARDNGKGGGDLNSESDIVGSWAGDRIAIVGDYHEKNDMLIVGQATDAKGISTLGVDNPWIEDDDGSGGGDWEDITDAVITAAREDRWIAQEMVEPKGTGWRQRPSEKAVA